MDADRLEREIRRLSVSQFVESCIETTARPAPKKDCYIRNLPTEFADMRGPRRLAESSAKSARQREQYLRRRQDHGQRFSGRRRINLHVSTPASASRSGDQTSIFERFYRVDVAVPAKSAAQGGAIHLQQSCRSFTAAASGSRAMGPRFRNSIHRYRLRPERAC